MDEKITYYEAEIIDIIYDPQKNRDKFVFRYEKKGELLRACSYERHNSVIEVGDTCRIGLRGGEVVYTEVKERSTKRLVIQLSLAITSILIVVLLGLFFGGPLMWQRT